MNRKEDQFFEMFRSSLADYQPEAPASVYTGIRKKMVWSNFLSFNATSLNVWYVALIVGAGLATIGYVNFSEGSGQLSQQHAALDELNIRQVAANTCVDTKVEKEQPVYVAAKSVVSQPKAKSTSSNPFNNGAAQANASAADNTTDISDASGNTDAGKAAKAEANHDAMLNETAKTTAPAELASVEAKEFQPYGFSAISTLAIPDLVDQIEDDNRDNIVMKMVVFGDKK